MRTTTTFSLLKALFKVVVVFLRVKRDASRTFPSDGEEVAVRSAEEVSLESLLFMTFIRFTVVVYVFLVERVSLRKRQAFVRVCRFVRVAESFKDA